MKKILLSLLSLSALGCIAPITLSVTSCGTNPAKEFLIEGKNKDIVDDIKDVDVTTFDTKKDSYSQVLTTSMADSKSVVWSVVYGEGLTNTNITLTPTDEEGTTAKLAVAAIPEARGSYVFQVVATIKDTQISASKTFHISFIKSIPTDWLKIDANGNLTGVVGDWKTGTPSKLSQLPQYDTLLIPNTVKSIAKDAFGTDTTAPAFPQYTDSTQKDKDHLVKLSLEFEKSEACPTLHTRCFYGCSGLSSISLPDDITFEDFKKDTDRVAIFEKCAGITSVDISNCAKLTHIPDRLFIGCTSLNEFKLPEDVDEIGDDCFDGCTELVNVDLSSYTHLTKLDKMCIAFGSSVQSKIQSLSLPGSITTIGEGAFLNIKTINTLVFNGWDSIDTTNWWNGASNHIFSNWPTTGTIKLVNCTISDQDLRDALIGIDSATFNNWSIEVVE